MRLDPFLYHVASGHAFFSGILLAVAGIGVRVFAPTRRRSATIPGAIGLLLIAVSATPFPWYAYAAWAATLAAWFRAESSRQRMSRRLLMTARIAAFGSCAAAAAAELPYHLTPRVPPAAGPAVAVIGDSVSAGMGENEAVTWPKLLAFRHDLVVHDHAAMGATVASARRQAARLSPDDGVVIVEIGGNDLLGSTSVDDFAAGLDRLLRDVARPGRSVVMFELPLPPGFNAYGRVQRGLAAKYGVALVPKRVLMGVFTGPGATLDSIHFSQAGHERMAAAVWEVIGDAVAPAQ